MFLSTFDDRMENGVVIVIIGDIIITIVINVVPLKIQISGLMTLCLKIPDM